MNNKTNKDENISSNDFIDLKIFFNLLIKNKFIISITTSAFFIFFCIYALLQERIWEGKFKIVVDQPDKSLPRQLIGTKAEGFLSNINLLGGTSNLNTQVEILRSPSVLLPIYEFINKEKKKEDENFVQINFEDWLKQKLDIKLTPRTSILNITYKDSNKNLIIPVLSKISNAYQIYSGKAVKRKILLAKNYLNSQIDTYKIKSADSLKKAQEFAFEEDLTVLDINSKKNNLDNVNLEQIRVVSLNKIRNIDKQLEEINKIGNDYEKFQYIAQNIFGAKQKILLDLNLNEKKLNEFKAKYKEKDLVIQNLLKERLILQKLLKDRLLANLKALRILEVAKMESVSRPKNVILKYKELMRTSERDEATLVQLENQLRKVNLEEAKYKDPWELITNPTLKESPISPNRRKIGSIGIVFGLFSGIIIASIRENFIDTNS